MSGLGYAAGGLAQGMQQGKQFRFDRQMKQREAGQRDTALQQAKDAQDYQKFKDVDDRYHDPNFQTKYSDAEKAKIAGARQGYLTAHPDYDYGHEFTPDPNAPQSPNPNGLPNIGNQSQAGPVLPPPPDQPGANNFGPQADGSQANPSVSGASAPPAAPQPKAIDPFVQQHDDLMKKAEDPLLSADQKQRYQEAAAAALVQGAVFHHTNEQARLAGAGADAAAAGLPYVAPQAKATLADTTATTAGRLATNKTIAPESTARINLENRQAGVAGAEAKAIPQRVQIERGNLDLARSGQTIDAAYKTGNLDLQQKTIALELQKFGISSAQFAIEQRKVAMQMGIDAANLNIALGTPGFNQKVLQQYAADHAFTTDKLGQQHPGPTWGMYQNVIHGGTANQQQQGQAPQQTPRQAPRPAPQQASSQAPQPAPKPAAPRYNAADDVGFGGSAGGGSSTVPMASGEARFGLRNGDGSVNMYNVAKYVSDSPDGASDKVNVLKSLGVPIPPGLASRAAIEQSARHSKAKGATRNSSDTSGLTPGGPLGSMPRASRFRNDSGG